MSGAYFTTLPVDPRCELPSGGPSRGGWVGRATQEESLDHKMVSRNLTVMMRRHLSTREELVLRLRNCNGTTLAVAGNHINRSAERARQVEMEAMLKIRRELFCREGREWLEAVAT